MSYFLASYFIAFLPIVIIIYCLTTQKFRWIVLLVADYVFFYMLSGKLIVFLLGSTFLAWGLGVLIGKIRANNEIDAKQKQTKTSRIMILGILISLGVLFILKYFNFVGENIGIIAKNAGMDFVFTPIDFLIPIGISYYTLQVISYLADVKNGKQEAVGNFFKIALYLSFFPQIMEGPISRYSQVGEDLYAGRKIEFVNLKFGYQRICWGLIKKFIVADRIAPLVTKVFDDYQKYDGSIILLAVLAFTMQLYAEFSGCMDIIIGSGEIFGIKLPENFRQPFFAKDASDFWHRWHITLGTWFKDYIFFPVSLAKPVKKFAKFVKKYFGKTTSKFSVTFIALFCVWICNGLWHGAKWTFIFYGLYYFVLIFIENLTEEPVKKLTAFLHIDRAGKGYKVFRFVKLFVIINLGEMFFRAETVKDGFLMLKNILSNFHLKELFANYWRLGLDREDLAAALVGIFIIIVVGVLKERGVNIRKSIDNKKLPLRWIFWYLAIFLIMVFGAYGPGYTAVDMIYAGY